MLGQEGSGLLPHHIQWVYVEGDNNQWALGSIRLRLASYMHEILI